MANKDEVLNVVAKVLNVKPQELIEDKTLYESVGVDSTEMVELVIALSKHFKVKLETKEITKFSTPQKIVEVINSKQNQ
ncbi:MAG: acyl carrier protein [Candidatus Omnitrophica bacterium]|nr:acyl carrier protein [Candidatus Omnitrophota bacterium]